MKKVLHVIKPDHNWGTEMCYNEFALLLDPGPQISMSQEKELNFFIQERNWHKEHKWYKSNFVGKH